MSRSSFVSRRRSRRQNSRQLSFESLEDRRLLATVPAGFTDTEIITGGLFTALQFDHNGRGWVAFDDGRIGVIENDTLITSSAYDVNASTLNDRGLLGLELDRNFEQNGYIYLAYAADDADPNAKLSRLQVDLTTGNTIIPGSETILLDLPSFSEVGNATLHIVGSVHHAADDTLYLQVGDHESFGVAQDLSSPFGKILRLNSDGTPATDNPYYDETDGLDWTDYVWASGVRNAFSGDIDPITGQYFISDVGSDSWEEINDATQPGLNFGWPTAEGPVNDISFTDPFYAYTHDSGCAIVGGTFYSGVTQQFPTEYAGRYFFADFCMGEIYSIDPNDHHDVQVFATGINGPLNIAFAPDGSMYYIELNDISIHKVEYTLDAPPAIVLQPSDTLVTVGSEASFSFSVGGSTPFTFQWQVDTGGGFVDLPGQTNAELVLSNLMLSDDGNQYRVVVSNEFGTETSDAALLTVTADTPPQPEILLISTSGSTYRAGDTLTFSGAVVDAEDGLLPASALTWKIDFHHNEHTHPVIESLTGTFGGQIVIPTTGETDPDVWYRVYLTATDSSGLQTTVFAEIFPEHTDFTVESTSPHADLFVDSQTESNPVKKTGVEGVLRTLTVPEEDPNQANVYFYQWLDGTDTAERVITTPLDNTSYVALYGYSNAFLDTVYLSDLSPVGTPINGWGPIELDMSNGGTAQGDGGVIILNGVVYDKGLGVHADSEIIYDLSVGNYSRFQADVGLNAGPRDSGEVIFEVYGDGVLLYSSGIVTGNSPTQSIDVDVTGIDELRLVVDGNGSVDSDSANWADARLTEVITNQQYLSDLTPVGTPVNGWGPVEFDMSNGGTEPGDGGVIQLNGISYEKGLGVHADSEIVYALGGEYQRFVSDIGIDGGPRDTGEVVFEVYGDDVLLYSSGIMTGSSPTQSLDLDVTGVTELRLVVDSNGSIDFDTANWADAHLLINDPGDLGDLRGITVEKEGILLQMLPYTGADATLDAKLNIDDVQALVQGWGARPVEDSLEDWIRAGDFNLDGTTNSYDWEILNSAWMETYGVALERSEFLDEQVTYVSDLPILPSSTNGLGPIELDTTNGDIASGDGGTIEINGVTYAKGLGVHAYSEVVVDLSAGSYDTFLADIGLDDSPRPTGEVVFLVYGDGELLYYSEVLTGNSLPESIDVDVTAVDELRLVVSGFLSNDDDSAVWADARLISYSEKDVLLADFTEDNVVSGADFLAWMRGFGTANPTAEKTDGDADYDADVDAEDLTLLLQSYGSAIPTVSQVASAASVLSEPEEQPPQTEVAAATLEVPPSSPDASEVTSQVTSFEAMETKSPDTGRQILIDVALARDLIEYKSRDEVSLPWSKVSADSICPNRAHTLDEVFEETDFYQSWTPRKFKFNHKDRIETELDVDLLEIEFE